MLQSFVTFVLLFSIFYLLKYILFFIFPFWYQHVQSIRGYNIKFLSKESKVCIIQTYNNNKYSNNGLIIIN